jgi:hypothetical protein
MMRGKYLKEVRKQAMRVSRERVFQSWEAAHAKVLRQKHGWSEE